MPTPYLVIGQPGVEINDKQDQNTKEMVLEQCQHLQCAPIIFNLLIEGEAHKVHVF